MHAASQHAHMHAHTNTHHVHVVSVVSRGSPGNSEYSLSHEHPYGGSRLSQTRWTVARQQPGNDLRADAGCFEHRFVVKATCRHNITAALSIVGLETWHKSPQMTNELPATQRAHKKHLLWAKIKTTVQHSSLQNEIHPPSPVTKWE